MCILYYCVLKTENKCCIVIIRVYSILCRYLYYAIYRYRLNIKTYCFLYVRAESHYYNVFFWKIAYFIGYILFLLLYYRFAMQPLGSLTKKRNKNNIMPKILRRFVYRITVFTLHKFQFHDAKYYCIYSTVEKRLNKSHSKL